MCKTSLHTLNMNPFYLCTCMFILTHIHNKYTDRQRDVAWPVVDIGKPGKENMNNVLWNCSLATTQSWNSCGIPQSLPGHAGSGLEYRVCNEETANLCRRLLCPAHDKSFQVQWQAQDFSRSEDCRQSRDKGLSRGREYSFKMLTDHLVTEKDSLPVPEVREAWGQMA